MCVRVRVEARAAGRVFYRVLLGGLAPDERRYELGEAEFAALVADGLFVEA